MTIQCINPLSPELNPICYLLALLAHHFLHVSRIRVKWAMFNIVITSHSIFMTKEYLLIGNSLYKSKLQ